MTTNQVNPFDSSQSSLNPFVAPFPEVMFISQNDFIRWTSRWEQTMVNTSSDVKQLFINTVDGNPAYLQEGVGFDSVNMLAFLSTVGLHTVHARFGISSEIDQAGNVYDYFQLILFGRDIEGTIVTPYMTGYPLYDKDINSIELIDQSQDNLGKVPKLLAKQWIQNWTTGQDGTPIVNGRHATTSMFNIYNTHPTQPLQGYTYKMREFLNTLYMDETTDMVYAILGLHKYPALESKYPASGFINVVANVYTFGLLFIGVHLMIKDVDGAEVNKNLNSSDLQVTGGYYDFSAPCPGTC